MKTYPFGLCDLHCDTLTEIADHKTGLHNTKQHISFDRVGMFSSYTQVMALWSNVRYPDDTCYAQFLSRTAYFQQELERHPEIAQCRTAEELRRAWDAGRQAIVLAIEGGNLLGEDLSRLDVLYDAGVRFFTLVWGGQSRMGGAHDVGGGLSPFGIRALKAMLRMGIIPDVSHASREIFYQTAAYADAAEKPFVATHSDSAALREHTRNLTDEQFAMVRDAKGLVGVSLCISHLCSEAHCTAETVADHIEHYLGLSGEHTVCLGCDFDGIETLPDGMTGVESLGLIADALARRGIPESVIADVFCGNVRAFLQRNL